MIKINFRKTLLLSIFVLVSVGAVCFAVPSFVSHDVPATAGTVWKRSEFDRLGLDVTFYPSDGEIDVLESLSIVNLQTAYYGKGIEKLILWTDKRGEGFQGTGVDQRIGEAVVSSLEIGFQLSDSTILTRSIDGKQDVVICARLIPPV